VLAPHAVPRDQAGPGEPSAAEVTAAEALSAEARERPRRRKIRIALIALALAIVLAVGTIAVRSWTGSSAGGGGGGNRAALGHLRTGTVTGKIEPCVAVKVNPANLPQWARVGHAGRVTVLRGPLGYKLLRPGVHGVVYPHAVVTSESVASGHSFSFRLRPGHYVLIARAGSSLWLPTAVSVAVGKTTAANIFSGCI
jgi:hypothetical protein